MNASAAARTGIAARVADELLDQPRVVEVWLEGALAEGLAHARSDIDLRVLMHGAPPGRWPSRMVDGVRVDLLVTTAEEMTAVRGLLGGFDVEFDDVETFRQARRQLGTLTRLRTARRRDGRSWQPVLGDAERQVYRRWAVADRVEHVLSLTEDLLGLLADEQHQAADIVWQQMDLAVCGLECVAAGEPLLGDKWLPALATRAGTDPPRSPYPNWDTGDRFTALRDQVTAALLSTWPLTADDGPVQPCPDRTTGFGWLPQRYTDGWFVRLGDERQPLTEPQTRHWHAHTSGRAQPSIST